MQSKRIISICKNSKTNDEVKLAELERLLNPLVPQEKYALVNARDEEGTTPLIHLSAYGSTKAIKFLLEQKADLYARDNEQEWDALETALEFDFQITAQYLAILMMQDKGIFIYESDNFQVKQYKLLRAFLFYSQFRDNLNYIILKECLLAFNLNDPENDLVSLTSQEKLTAYSHPLKISVIEDEVKDDAKDEDKKSSLQIDADDSSDEEESTLLGQDYPAYFSERALQNASKIPEYIQEIDEDQNNYSYFAHLLSINRFYSGEDGKEINAEYYKRKEQLSLSEVFSTDEEMENWIRKSIKKLLGITLSETKPNELRNELIESFLKKDLMFLKTPQLKRILLKQLNTDQVLDDMAVFVLTVKGAIESHIREYDISNNQLEEPIAFVQDNFKESIFDYTEPFLRENKFLKEDNKFCSVNDRPEPPNNLSEIDKIIVAYIEKYTNARTSWKSFKKGNFFQYVYNKLIDLEIRSKQCLLSIEKTRTDRKVSFRIDIDFDEGVIENMMRRLPFSVLFVSEDFQKKYIPPTIKAFKKKLVKQVRKHFTSGEYIVFLKKNFRGIKIERGIVPSQYLFKSNNFVEFYANIRLAMRIQKRRIRQAMTDQESVNIVEISFQSAWQFGDMPTPALETQSLSINAARTDWVINLGSYPEISKALNLFIVNNKIDGKEIAKWILVGLIFNHKELVEEFDRLEIPKKTQKKLEIFIPNLAYLLLGCEVQRNPAAYLINLIVIDLIRKEELTWQDALAKKEYQDFCAGGEMPMSMGAYSVEGRKTKVESSPVKCARLLQRHYGFFAIKQWKYHGEEASESNREKSHIEELVRRENAIVKKWMQSNQNENKPLKEQITILEKFGSDFTFRRLR